MREVRTVFRILLLSTLLLNSGCAHCSASGQDEEMYTLASALTKLTSAVEEKVLFKEAPSELKDMDLITLSTSHDRGLMAPFSEYLLKAATVNGHAVVMVCDQGGRKALLEDGGCSSILDRHWWRDQPNHSCEVSTTVCAPK